MDVSGARFRAVSGLRRARGAETILRMFLELYEGVGETRRVPLEPGLTLRIGRTADCDLVLGGPGVSRHHCTLSVEGDQVRLENHSSTKAGTQLNGARVEGLAELSPGDEVSVGEVVLVFQAAQPPAAEAPRKRERAKPEPPAPAAASSSAEESAEEASAEPERRDPRAATEAFLARKRQEQLFRRAVFALCGLVALGTVAWVISRRAPSAEPSPVAGREQPARPSTSEAPAPPAATRAADGAWQAVRESAPTGLGAALEAFAAAYPDDPRAGDARFFAERLRAAPARSEAPRALSAVVDAMLKEAERLVAAKEPARASAVLELVGALLPGSPQARRATLEQAKLAEVAKEAFAELSAHAREVAARLSPVQAIVAVLEASPRLRGLGVDGELDQLVAGLEEEAAQAAARRGPVLAQRSGEAFTLEQDLVNAALRQDYELAWRHADALLRLPLDEEQRLRAHWLRHRLRGLQALFQATLAAAKDPQLPRERRPSCTLPGNLVVRLVGSAGREAQLKTAAAPGESAGELTWPWTRFAPSQLQELFAEVRPDDLELTLAKAFHAFRTGLDERGVSLLLPWAGRKRSQGEAWSLYSLVTGVPVPEGGFVVFEGQLVSPARRDEIRQERREAREAARALAQQAREEDDAARLRRVLAKVLAFMDQGHYQAGRAALAKLAERHADVPGVGDEAKARLESPLLRRRDLRLSKELGRNGPPKNRLDIYFLGDGYVFDDKKQLQFDRHADSAAKFCQLQDFFKEYDQYINYWALNLESKDEGLTRDGQRKETVLGSEVNGGVHTVGDRGRVFGLLDRLFPGEHDRLAVVLGNDHASVATGGGGTVAVCKTMLEATPHEIGHAFGGLADEYDQEPTPNAGPPTPYTGAPRAVRVNVVAAPTRKGAEGAAPWQAWLDPSGEKNWTGKPIGAFEGANRQPKGYWRPQRQCVMRDVGSPFCAVCMEVMVRGLYRIVKPIDQTWPAETELSAGREPITFRVLVMKPTNHPLFVHWRRKRLEWKRPETGAGEGQDEDETRERGPMPPKDAGPATQDVSGKLQVIEGRFVHYIKVLPRKLDPGRYEISAEVWDPTPWVRDEHRAELTQTHRWILTVPPR